MTDGQERFELTYTGAPRAMRLDVFLAEAVGDLTRSRAARLIRNGQVTVNGQGSASSRRLQPGDIVQGEVPPVAEELAPEPGPIVRLIETDEFIAVDKPAGIVMHPGAGAGSGTLAHRLLAHYQELSAVGHPRRPGIVHRLDKDTSGVVLIARTPAMYTRLAQAFERREVRKQYLLIARGVPEPPRGRIDAPIGRHPTHRTRMAVVHRGRPAVTDYRVLGRAGRGRAGASQPNDRPHPPDPGAHGGHWPPNPGRRDLRRAGVWDRTVHAARVDAALQRCRGHALAGGGGAT